MNNSRLSTLSLTLAVAVFALGYVNPSFADKPIEGMHGHGDGDEDPPPPIEVCASSPCITSVGKWHHHPARQYAEDNKGTYTALSSKDFANILATLPDGFPQDFTALCDAYDVLIFEWSSPNIKGLDWDSLENYMECGGGIIWEDPKNIDKLGPDVMTLNIRVHDSTESPKTIELCPTTGDEGIAEPILILCAAVPVPVPLPEGGTTLETTFTVVNNHIDFIVGTLLEPFLIQTLPVEEADKVLGLYGTFGNGGCIVMTGPDNNFHGKLDDTVPRANQYHLLFNELNWLLKSTACSKKP